MKDGPVRTLVKRIALGCFHINVKSTRAIWRARGDRPYKLGGACEMCAACCERPSIQTGRMVWYFPMLRGLFLAWHKHINGFELVERIPGRRIFVFRCTHFDWETRRCDSYHSRPGMCRDYPRALLWQANPSLLPGCGYRAVDPRADEFLDALKREGIDGEQLDRVKKKLHLDK